MSQAVWPYFGSPGSPSPPEFTPPGWQPATPVHAVPSQYPPVPVVPVVSGLSGGGADSLEGVLAQLREHGVVMLTGRLDTAAMTDAAAQLMLLDASGDDPIELRLLSEDGDLDPAMALADTIDLLGVPLTVVATGVVGGVALAPYCAADRRRAHPRARFVFGDPELSVDGRVEAFANAVAGFQQQLGDFHARVAAACGQPRARVADDMAAGLVLTADQALDYGLVQELAVSARKRG